MRVNKFRKGRAVRSWAVLLAALGERRWFYVGNWTPNNPLRPKHPEIIRNMSICTVDLFMRIKVLWLAEPNR